MNDPGFTPSNEPPEQSGPAAPPTVPGRVVVRRLAAWPAALGTWGVVMGVIWTVVAAWGAVASVGQIVSSSMGLKGVIVPEYGLPLLLRIAAVVIGVGMVDAGASLLRRRVRGARLMFRWSCAQLVSTLTVLVLFHVTGFLQSTWGFVGAVFVIVFDLAFPLVAIVWLCRPSIQSQLEATLPAAPRRSPAE